MVPFFFPKEAPCKKYRAMKWGTLLQAEVSTQLAGKIKGFARKFALRSASAFWCLFFPHFFWKKLIQEILFQQMFMALTYSCSFFCAEPDQDYSLQTESCCVCLHSADPAAKPPVFSLWSPSRPRPLVMNLAFFWSLLVRFRTGYKFLWVKWMQRFRRARNSWCQNRWWCFILFYFIFIFDESTECAFCVW